MRLHYYDHTPSTYEPSGFRTGSGEQHLSFDGAPLRIKVGEVDTPFHEVSLALHTKLDALDPSEENEGHNFPAASQFGGKIYLDEEAEKGGHRNVLLLRFI